MFPVRLTRRRSVFQRVLSLCFLETGRKSPPSFAFLFPRSYDRLHLDRVLLVQLGVTHLRGTSRPGEKERETLGERERRENAHEGSKHGRTVMKPELTAFCSNGKRKKIKERKRVIINYARAA